MGIESEGRGHMSNLLHRSKAREGTPERLHELTERVPESREVGEPSDASTGIPIPPPPVEIEPAEAPRRPPWGWIIALLLMAVAGIAAVLAAVVLQGDGDESADTDATEQSPTAEPSAEEADTATDEPAPEPESFSLVAAAEVTSTATTARYETTRSVEGTAIMTTTGAIDADLQLATRTIDMHFGPRLDEPAEREEVLDAENGVFFERELTDSGAWGPWTSMDVRGVASWPSTEPFDITATFAGSDQVLDLGSTTAGGVELRHFLVTVDYDEAVRADPWLAALSDELTVAPTDIAYDVWVSGDNLIHRYSFEIVALGDAVLVDTLLTDVGTPIAIDVPSVPEPPAGEPPAGDSALADVAPGTYSLSEASEQMTATSTAQTEMHFEEGDETAHSIGGFDNEAGIIAQSVTTELADGTVDEMEMIIDVGNELVFLRYGGGPLGGGWESVDLTTFAAYSDVSLADLEDSYGADPADFAMTPEQLEGYVAVGLETMDGVDVMHYEMTGADVLDASPDLGLPDAATDAPGTTVEAHMWVSEDNRLVRFGFVFALEFLDERFSMRMDFYGFGEPLGIEIPAPEDATDISDEFGDLMREATG